jgi:inorganic pyrophosphatase
MTPRLFRVLFSLAGSSAFFRSSKKSKGKTERNDRLFAVPRDSHSEQALKDVSDLSKPIREELEKFFKATDELEDKKLNILGWKGPKAAIKAIKAAAKSLKKDGE